MVVVVLLKGVSSRWWLLQMAMWFTSYRCGSTYTRPRRKETVTCAWGTRGRITTSQQMSLQAGRRLAQATLELGLDVSMPSHYHSNHVRRAHLGLTSSLRALMSAGFRHRHRPSVSSAFSICAARLQLAISSSAPL